MAGLRVTQTYYSISEDSTIIQQSKTASDLSRCHSKQLTKPFKCWLKKKICTISNQYLSWDFFHQLSRHAEGRLAESSQQPGSPRAEPTTPLPLSGPSLAHPARPGSIPLLTLVIATLFSCLGTFFSNDNTWRGCQGQGLSLRIRLDLVRH